MPSHSNLGLAEHLPFPQNTPAFPRPVRELAYTVFKFLPAGATFHLEVSLLRFPTVMCETQKGKLLWLLSPFPRIFARKTAKFDAAGLVHREFQTETFQSVL